MKYIIFEDFAGQAIPIIFPERVDYVEFREQIPYPAVLAAGKVKLTDTGFICYGESKELGVKSSSNDAKIIEQYLKKD
ncbi:hypothetical protein [Desulfonauticus submarinus]|uniref:Uncharacterized protein n=1 Tax=Desulfonauticus submarinus TaxID=206665 RepID=A0A1H0A281_9BACT|nr:hypothetical protein [Desulfonauticus submarinus]SDN27912.1 hypothetical protein SAMN04488516_101264 [Desulfonauticus submarinus]